MTKKIGLRAKAIAEHSGRTEVNLLDVGQSLDVLSLDRDALEKYLLDPPVAGHFCREVTEFPIKANEVAPVEALSYTNDNIPTFLPEFPAAHTYTFTPVPLQTSRDPATARVLKAHEKQEVEAALTSLLYSSPMVGGSGLAENVFTETHSLEEAKEFFT